MKLKIRVLAYLLVLIPTTTRAQITYDDYPPQALREHRQGVTKIKVRINADGRVEACAIDVTSGHTDLDEKACEIAVGRFRFKPALQNDLPVVSTKVISIRWQIAAAAPVGPTSDDYPPIAMKEHREGAVQVDLLIGTNGRVKECAVLASSGSSDLDEAACSLATRRFVYSAEALDWRKVQTIRWVLPKP